MWSSPDLNLGSKSDSLNSYGLNFDAANSIKNHWRELAESESSAWVRISKSLRFHGKNFKQEHTSKCQPEQFLSWLDLCVVATVTLFCGSEQSFESARYSETVMKNRDWPELEIQIK